jgi:hypothetical protein
MFDEFEFNFQLRRLTLYPTELRAHRSKTTSEIAQLSSKSNTRLISLFLNLIH